MTQGPPVSVVVVSHGRPAALARCLTGLTQLSYPKFEIIVVADKAGLNHIDRLPALFGQIKTARFDSANISHARNFGLAQAAGEIVAFIDDDAVPEPLWLDHLTQPFADSRVMSAGGTVLGRNGFTRQWGPRCILPNGQCQDMEQRGDGPTLYAGHPGMGIKTEGTNMAFRRDVLAGIGGFDPAFRFYLDESDVNLRLAAQDHAAALVPRAVVHHGFLESARRRADRVPTDLHEIGASLSVFLRKHAPGLDHGAAYALETQIRRRALIEHMVAGRIEPRDIRPILATLDAGFAEGQGREISALLPLPAPTAPFLSFRAGEGALGRNRVTFGRIWRRRALRQRAAAMALEGGIVTAFVLSPTIRPHQARFMPEGYWLHSGGRFGKSRRTDRWFRYWSLGGRVRRELKLLAPVRGEGSPDRAI